MGLKIKQILKYLTKFIILLLIFFIFYFLTIQRHYFILILSLFFCLGIKNLSKILSFLLSQFYFVLFSIDFVRKREFMRFFPIIILIFLVLNLHNSFFVNLFFWFAVILIYISIFKLLRWTYNPFETWEDIVNNKILKFLKEKYSTLIEIESIKPQKNFFLYTGYMFGEMICHSIKTETYKRTLMNCFLLYLFTYFTLSIFLYSFYYYNIALINPATISGIHSLMDSFYFSFLTSVTIGDSSVAPQCGYIKFIIMTQVFIGLFLLVFIFLSFGSISMRKSEQSFDTLHSNIQGFLEKDIIPKIDLENTEIKEFLNKNNLAKEMFEKLRKSKEK